MFTDRTVPWVPVFRMVTVSPFWAGRSMGRGGRRFLPNAQFVLRLVEPVAQAGPLVVDRLPILFLLGLFPHVSQLPEDFVGGAPGLVQDGAGLRLGPGLVFPFPFCRLSRYSWALAAACSISSRSWAAWRCSFSISWRC